jgi:hypothetical protein
MPKPGMEATRRGTRLMPGVEDITAKLAPIKVTILTATLTISDF